jgi:hypothetical protein
MGSKVPRRKRLRKQRYTPPTREDAFVWEAQKGKNQLRTTTYNSFNQGGYTSMKSPKKAPTNQAKNGTPKLKKEEERSRL